MSPGITEEEMKEIHARQEQLARELQAEELARYQEWRQERAEGAGVTLGAAAFGHPFGLSREEMEEDEGVLVTSPADFEEKFGPTVPDTSILGQDTNPKELAATRDQKAPLHLLEHAADCEIAAALSHGAHKYGRKNFHQTPILANVYGGAIRRHIGQWLDGEDFDKDSGLSHLAHIGANIHVLFASMAAGTFTDDRGPEEQSEVQARLSAASNRSRP